MQKACDLMNIKIHQVINDISGVSGMRILRAIISGERDAEELANLCESSIDKKKRKEVIESLNGNYREEHIFALSQAIECWEFYNKQIKRCDKEIEKVLIEMGKDKEMPTNIKPPKPIRYHKPEIKDLHEKLMTILGGRDASQIVELTDSSLMKLIAECGTDLDDFKTVKNYTSWLGLAPWKNSSGKRNKKFIIVKNDNKAGQIFRQLA
jgi:transposase